MTTTTTSGVSDVCADGFSVGDKSEVKKSVLVVEPEPEEENVLDFRCCYHRDWMSDGQ